LAISTRSWPFMDGNARSDMLLAACSWHRETVPSRMRAGAPYMLKDVNLRSYNDSETLCRQSICIRATVMDAQPRRRQRLLIANSFSRAPGGRERWKGNTLAYGRRLTVRDNCTLEDRGALRARCVIDAQFGAGLLAVIAPSPHATPPVATPLVRLAKTPRACTDIVPTQEPVPKLYPETSTIDQRSWTGALALPQSWCSTLMELTWASSSSNTAAPEPK
jgi:hypothetical protein